MVSEYSEEAVVFYVTKIPINHRKMNQPVEHKPMNNVSLTYLLYLFFIGHYSINFDVKPGTYEWAYER